VTTVPPEGEAGELRLAGRDPVSASDTRRFEIREGPAKQEVPPDAIYVSGAYVSAETYQSATGEPCHPDRSDLQVTGFIARRGASKII
jgi:hypothetical protein